MANDNCAIGLFSGRFDPPTAGHFMAVETLLMKYAQIIVVVLDYKGREFCSAINAKKLWDYHFDITLSPIARSKVVTVVNKHHFGFITKKQLNTFLKKNNLVFDTYISGNVEVLEHMKKLEYKCQYLPRVAFPLDYSVYSATNVRKAMTAYDMSLEDYYRLQKKK